MSRKCANIKVSAGNARLPNLPSPIQTFPDSPWLCVIPATPAVNFALGRINYQMKTADRNVNSPKKTVKWHITIAVPTRNWTIGGEIPIFKRSDICVTRNNSNLCGFPGFQAWEG